LITFILKKCLLQKVGNIFYYQSFSVLLVIFLLVSKKAAWWIYPHTKELVQPAPQHFLLVENNSSATAPIAPPYSTDLIFGGNLLVQDSYFLSGWGVGSRFWQSIWDKMMHFMQNQWAQSVWIHPSSLKHRAVAEIFYVLV